MFFKCGIDNVFVHRFQPTYECSNIISNIIKAKYDEPTASWLKVSVNLRNGWFGEFKGVIRAIFETKGSRILKSSMDKIRNGQDKGKHITTNVRAALDENWGSIDFLNKSSTAKTKEFQRPPTAWEVIEKTKKLNSEEWVNDKSREFVDKYQHRQDEILQHLTNEGTSTQDSPNTATSVNDNEIYLNVVGGPNYKGKMYGLDTLSKKFSCSKSISSTSIAHL
ncbi:hypothetical protein GmHk_10G028171 [Glycine max]|nr:hypothetical protein GmHk_10G028171 [Glycine max]